MADVNSLLYYKDASFRVFPWEEVESDIRELVDSE